MILLSVAQVAEKCGVSRDVVRGWVHGRGLRARNLGTKTKVARYFIEDKDLEAFMAKVVVGEELAQTRRPRSGSGKKREVDAEALQIMERLAQRRPRASAG